jgi:hypothetical protein
MGYFGLHHFAAALPALTILACGLLIGAYFVVPGLRCASVSWLVGDKAGAGWPLKLGWTAIYAAVAFRVILFSRHLDRLVAANRAAEEAERAAVVAERTRFAREIHDTLAQGFTGIVVQLNAAEQLMIRILIVDDHAVVRDGLAAMLETQPDLEAAGQAGDGREAVERFRELQPDVVLMHLAMPVSRGRRATC